MCCLIYRDDYYHCHCHYHFYFFARRGSLTSSLASVIQELSRSSRLPSPQNRGRVWEAGLSLVGFVSPLFSSSRSTSAIHARLLSTLRFALLPRGQCQCTPLGTSRAPRPSGSRNPQLLGKPPSPRAIKHCGITPPLIWFNCLTKKHESLTVEEMFVQGFRQENTRKTNIYSTAPIFMLFANYMR